MKLPLFIILTGMVTITFARVKLQKTDSYYNDIVEGGRYAPFVGEPIDTLPKQSYIMFQETGTSIFHNGIEVALRRKNGTWKVIDSRKAMEVMYQNIYTRDSVRRKK